MIYIKTFEAYTESYTATSFIRLLRKADDDYLAYLKDMGFKLKVVTLLHNNWITLLIPTQDNGNIVNNGRHNKDFKWVDIKYDLIPFLEHLNSLDIVVDDILFFCRQSKESGLPVKNTFHIEDLINDTIVFDYMISYISIPYSIIKRKSPKKRNIKSN